MSTQYFCKNEQRRLRVRDHATLNGVDFLEVLDRDAPAGSPRQQTLLVRCLKPVPPGFTGENLRIEGGVRIKPVKVLWGAVANAIPPALVNEAEKAFFLALPEPDHVLVVRTDSSGDYSTYTLRLVSSSTNPAPPAGFDLQLSEVAFSFKVECPSDFDCKTSAVCPPEKLPEPEINYLAKDYSSFRRLMLDRLSVIMPQWRERNPADLGITLVEALAYAGDHLSYFQDAVATEAYLGTARRRVSVRRHARLLDYSMHDGCNARVWVWFELTEPSDADGQTLPAGTRLLAPAPEGPPAIPSANLENEPVVFETMHDLVLHLSHNRISFYTWSDTECCLPRGATRAALKSEPSLALADGDVLIFEETASPTAGLPADPSHRQAVRLKRVTPVVDAIENIAVLEIEWHEEDALRFPLCLTARVAGAPVEISVARGNVVLADDGRTIEAEALIPPIVPGEGKYRPQLARPGIIFGTPYKHNAAKTASASAATVQDPHEALPLRTTLEAGGEPWAARRELLGSDRFAQEFVVEVEGDGTALLRFGDDLLGRKPDPGVEFQASYRVGNGRAGNLGAEALGRVITTLTGIKTVRNPLPATGGTDPESMEEVRQFAPEAFRTQQRAVTEADYAEVAGRHPGVQRAAARFQWTGSWYTVFVTIDRTGGRPVDAEFKTKVRDFIEQFRLAGYDLEINAPVFVPLDITLMICAAPEHFRANVKQALLEVFSARDLPDGTRGFFHPDNFTFGQPVYLSQIYQRAMAVPGVASVEAIIFQRWGKKPNQELENGVLVPGNLEIVRLDNDPNFPENGRLLFDVEGGL